jgi:hypothetical protein
MVQKFLTINEEVEMQESEAAAKASSPTDSLSEDDCKNTILHPFDHQVRQFSTSFISSTVILIDFFNVIFFNVIIKLLV